VPGHTGAPTKETRVKTRTLIRTAAAAAVVALAGVLAGCGNSATPAASPSTIYPQSSATGTLPALKTYLGDAQSVLDQVATTVGALPDAVTGLSAKPDDTWQSSAAQLESIATQLGDEAAALAALQPPSALQPVQDAVVKGIQATQSGVQKLAARIQSGSAKAAQIQAEVDKYRSQIEGLAQQLESALGALTGQ
jgi:peptidoglycan hydrolase CwlO-like protein